MKCGRIRQINLKKSGIKRESIVVLGILAHVDAGKTTLSEAILYTSGNLRKLGRVDNWDAFLDTYELERKRGITIFSKQAMLTYEGYPITLLDTPGHVDFSAEMERTLQVLDAAILVISASDGVQGHTRTLWRLLKRYEIPTFLFINKMDQPDVDKAQLITELTKELDGGCIDFGKDNESLREEALAMCDEELLNQFLESGSVQTESVKKAVRERKVFPCFFGSALKLWGVEELLQGLKEYAELSGWSDEFGARVFKITRDGQGNRLTHLKVTGGKLQAKNVIASEKINQIRLYSGDKFESVTEVRAGDICAVTGLQETYPGQGFGFEKEMAMPILEPVLSYCVELPEETDAAVMLPKLRQLEEEDPMLQIDYSEEHGEIYAKVMGEVQLEVLQSMIEERFGVTVSFGTGKIVYKETIAKPVEGVGHFEPLRHYAEVHLLLEPGEAGSGLTFAADCSEDVLSRNWQRLVLTHLEERAHRGVLTGSVITDMKITLVTGKAHLKHTEGGDFRQATYRAVRQGLMEAESVLLEPMYEFRLEIPQEAIGRAMTDVEKMHGRCILEQREGKLALLTGTAPVVTMREYQKEVTAYTKGTGKLSCELKGYMPCHNAQEVIAAIGYDPEADLANPTGSVFCAHGAGFVVPWHQVKDYMHQESCFSRREADSSFPRADTENEIFGKSAGICMTAPVNKVERFIGTEEIDDILSRSTHANSRRDGNKRKEGWQREHRRDDYGLSTGSSSVTRIYKGKEKKDAYLLVDGYNIIFAWEELKELAQHNLDSARGKLLDILCNYQGMKRCELIAVFDAYRVQGHPTEIMDYHNIHVVYTKEAETADQYIEKFAHENGKKYDVTVATSDGLEQIIIRSQGCHLLSARDLQEEIQRMSRQLDEEFLDKQISPKRYLLDEISGEVAEALGRMETEE